MFVKRRKPATAPEQRMHRRVALDAEITVDSEHNFYVGLSENISEGGLFISTFELAEVGSELELSFTLPGHDTPLKARGRVQWVREYSPMTKEVPPGIGLQFIDPTPELMQAVRDFIRSREPTFYE